MFENNGADARPAEAAVPTTERCGAVEVDVVAAVAPDSGADDAAAPSVASAAATAVAEDAVVVAVRISVEPLVADAGAENADPDTTTTS